MAHASAHRGSELLHTVTIAAGGSGTIPRAASVEPVLPALWNGSGPQVERPDAPASGERPRKLTTGNRVNFVSNKPETPMSTGLSVSNKSYVGSQDPIEYPIGDVSEPLRKQENPDAIGVFTVARPGLEPGTPRFSDRCAPNPNRPGIPAHKRVSAPPARRPEVRKLREMVGDVGHGVARGPMGVPARTVGVPWTPSALVSAQRRAGPSATRCARQR
jgi:hypothetical protein